MYNFISKSENETMDLASDIAGQLSTGDIIVLSGDLGSGKTKFVEGFLDYYGLDKEISSPTFTIVNEHDVTVNNNFLPIYHFDVYRLADIDEFYAIGGDEYFNNGICLIEWGELIEPILPKEYLKISFTRNDIEENTRILNIFPYGEKFENIIKEILE